MKSTPVITVIVPTYNAASFIEQTLSSVLKQTVDALEVIVVDDGSSDNTCQIADGLDKRVQVIRQTRAGVCVARNRGLAQARGRYVCFLDHDDVWQRDKLAAQLQVFDQDSEVALVHTDYWVWKQDASGAFPAAQSMLEEHPTQELDTAISGWVYHHLLVDSFILTSTAMLRTDAVREVGGFDPELPYSEDWDLWLRMARRWRFSKLKGRFALYRQLPSQGSRKFREIDYRTQLIERAVATWGISSPDGQSHGAAAVRRQIGRFHAGYGLDCLKAGAVSRASQAFFKAWRCEPSRAKYLVYFAAGRMGWRPSW
jgi:hypothetical protein